MKLEVGKTYIDEEGNKVEIILDLSNQYPQMKRYMIGVVHLEDKQCFIRGYSIGGEWNSLKEDGNLVREYEPPYREPDASDIGMMIEVRDHDNQEWRKATLAGYLRLIGKWATYVDDTSMALDIRNQARVKVEE